MSDLITYDISIWERIRSRVKLDTDRLEEKIKIEIVKDDSLREYHGRQSIPWQLSQVMTQRAQSWIQRIYELCCEAQSAIGEPLSAEFRRAVWAYWIQPFIMDEQETGEHRKRTRLQILLLLAAGPPPAGYRSNTVTQLNACLTVRNEIWKSWQAKLLGLSSNDEFEARLRRGNEVLTAFARTVAGFTPVPLPPTNVSTVHEASMRQQSPLEPSIPAIPTSHALISPPLSSDLEPHVIPEADDRLAQSSVEVARTWRDIAICFLSDFKIEIRAGEKIEALTYGELGMDDRRVERSKRALGPAGHKKPTRPKRAWLTLRELAEKNGVLEFGTKSRIEWPKVEKDIQALRKVLQKHIGIQDDPIPFLQGTYRTQFKLSCSPSFDR